MSGPTISVAHLNYSFPNGTLALKDLNINLPQQSRTLLIGANGAGKSTLLRLLSGKHLCTNGKILIGGVDPFKDGLEGVTYLGLGKKRIAGYGGAGGLTVGDRVGVESYCQDGYWS